MQFSPGQTVIHPHHGPSIVTNVFERQIKGVPRTYLELRVRRTDLTVSVPVDMCDEIGLRTVADPAQVAQLVAVLQAPSDHEEEHWSRRIKANHDKLMLGDVMVTAGVVRNLTRRSHGDGLSAAEKDMLKQARQPVLGELAEALQLPDEEVEQLLDDAIRGEDVSERLAQLAPAS